jgi:hypothetical protein
MDHRHSLSCLEEIGGSLICRTTKDEVIAGAVAGPSMPYRPPPRPPMAERRPRSSGRRESRSDELRFRASSG